jgi:glyoxylase-like metal-dependent hydrolase (beta-lactamase superfamily II)
VRVQELGPGLWRWTAFHPEWSPDEEWGQEVGCVYQETDDAITLIDPLVPPEDPGAFFDALDRDVERATRPVHILITIFWHARSAAALAERYPGTRVWAHEPARELVEERTAVTDVLRAGETLPGGIVPYDAGRAYEVVFWLPEHAALVTGDVLLGRERGDLALCPIEWLGTRDPADVRAVLRESLLSLPVEHILPAHGEPILSNAAGVLEAALTANDQ